MYIPRLADRVSCMIFRRRFKQELEEIVPVIGSSEEGVRSIR